MYTSPLSRHASAYRQVDVETRVHAASPHELIRLLFDELLDTVRKARQAVAQRDVARKSAAIGKAVRIVNEGLRASLDMQAGGELARNLDTLYDCLVLRLTLANLRNDTAPLDEAEALITPVRNAWVDIRNPGASTQSAAHQ